MVSSVVVMSLSFSAFEGVPKMAGANVENEADLSSWAKDLAMPGC